MPDLKEIFDFKNEKYDLIFVLCPPYWVKTVPLSAVCLSSFLKKNEFKVMVLDLNILTYHLSSGAVKKKWLLKSKQFEEDLYNKIRDFIQPAVDYINSAGAPAAFSCFDRNIEFTRKFLKNIKTNKVIAGGPQILREKIKGAFNIKGEGEKPLLKILSSSFSRLPSEFDEIKNLDSLPFYDLSAFNLNLYASKTLPLLSSRGCLKKCAFCSEKFLYKKYRRHSAEYMTEHIKYLMKKYKSSSFVFHDSAVNLSTEWLEKFCLKIINKKLNIKWEAQGVITDKLDERLFRLMQKSGCYNMFFGFESASDRVLEKMKKGINAQTALNMFKEAKKAAFNFELSFITDFPGETDEMFKETLFFIKKNKDLIPKIAQVNPFVKDKLLNLKKGASNRYDKFVRFLIQNKIRHTKAFLGNLTDK